MDLTQDSMEKQIPLNKNLVLIGMPGCGKTTLGRMAAIRLNLPFTDVDEYIVEREGRTIADIFQEGEESFRSVETRALEEAVKTGPKVIATGGGVVTVPQNRPILNRNSVIIFINRPVEKIFEDIDAESRPLLKSNPGKLFELYKARLPLYREFMDFEVENTGEMWEAVEDIVKIYFEE